jgi:glutathione S-transferase
LIVISAPVFPGIDLALTLSGPPQGCRPVKLYYAPGACGLADHIPLHRAELQFEHKKVDLGQDDRERRGLHRYNPKGYVPALTLNSNDTLFGNTAILGRIAHQDTALNPEGAIGHTHLP